MSYLLNQYKIKNRWLEDVAFGEISEIETFNMLKKNFMPDLEKCPTGFIMDFQNDNYFIELKTRNNVAVLDYIDTMVGKNKIDFSGMTNKKTIYLFRFTNGYYYWIYNTHDLLNGNVLFRIGGREDRQTEEIKEYAYIKTDILKKLKLKGSDLLELSLCKV